MFRHAAKTSTARIGDFERPLFPFVARVARAAVRDAAEKLTAREHEPEAYSYEAEVLAIRSRYGTAIDAVRRLNLPRQEIEAIIRGLREQQRKELIGVRQRRKAKAAQASQKP
jgi:hypothetical protein